MMFRKNHIYKVLKSVSGLLLLLCTFALAGCVESLLPEPGDPDNVESENLTIYFNLSLSGNNTSSRSETEGDGTSNEDKKKDPENPEFNNEDTYKAEENENIIHGFKLYFYYYDDKKNDYDSFFLSSPESEPLDFNKDPQNKKTITLSIEPEILKKIAGNENVELYFVGNSNDQIEAALEKFNPMTAKVTEIRYPDSQYNSTTKTYTITNRKEWDWLGKFEKGGFSMPIVSSSHFKVNLKDLEIGELESFQRGEGYNGKNYKEVRDNLIRVLGAAFGGRTLYLERINARIDIADGSPDKNNPNMYPLFYTQTGHEAFFKDGKCLLNLKLTRIDPVTVHKQSYIFRHTALGDEYGAFYNESPNGDGSEDNSSGLTQGYQISLFGDEMGTDSNYYNWVIDCDAEDKKLYREAHNWTQSSEDNTFLRDHFYLCPLRRDNHSLAFFYLGALLSYTGMEFDGKHPVNESRHHNHLYDGFHYSTSKIYGNREYYPWRYMPENTMPSQKDMIRGFSSGVRYEVILCNENGEPFTRDMVRNIEENGEGLPYKFEIYHIDNSVTGDRLRITIGEEMVDEIFFVGSTPEDREGFVRLYYYYFFRHNFNSNDPVAPKPMKYGLVRNNIYRLCLTGFNGLPRPYNFEEPDDPYDLIVDLNVMNWTKRQTSITFK